MPVPLELYIARAQTKIERGKHRNFIKSGHKRNIAVLDLETDPFEHGKMIEPFVAGFYDGKRFITFWSENCIERIVEFLKKERTQWTIFAHNGGRFDFFYFLDYIRDDLRIVNSRIIQARLDKHELRDSFAIMPFPLEAYRKTEIDYAKFTKDRRDKHKDEILSYLRDDCTDLYALCTAFVEEFGDALTIGSASMKQIKQHHTFKCGNHEYDSRLRPYFYFGGRNQVFRSGILKQPIRVYDVNSMYPYVMRSCLHPIGTGIIKGTRVDHNTSFIIVEGRNLGAFPTRLKDNSLDFTREYGVFHTTIHEYNAALETGTFRPHKIIQTFGFMRHATFDEFVDHFYHARAKAKAKGDTIRTLFYKFVLNSGYGKFAQNPENYFDWKITEVGQFPDSWHSCQKSCIEPCRQKWTPAFINDSYIIWKRPIKDTFYYNIATGASITGAARAILLKGIHAASNPMYCDTDSIICSDLRGVAISDTDLGSWKLECSGTLAAICGKKLYAIFDSKGECVKKAHKGARLTGEEILKIAKGEEIEAANSVPTFCFDGSHTFTKRLIRRTA